MRRSFWLYLYQQAQVLLNDTAAKFILTSIVIAALPEAEGDGMKNVFAAIPILPFLLLAPGIGWLCDRFPKRELMLILSLTQTAVLMLMIAAVAHAWIPGLMICLFLLGVQGSLYSAAKQSVLRELVSPERLGLAVSMGEMAGIACILGGTVAGGRLFDYLWHWNTRLPWDAGVITLWPFAVLGVLAFLAGLGIDPTPVPPSRNLPASGTKPFLSHINLLRTVWSNPAVRPGILGNAYFFSFGGALYLTLYECAQEIVARGPGVASLASTFLGSLGLGFILGAIAVAWFQRDGIRLSLVALGMMGLAFGCLLSGWLPIGSWWFTLAIGWIGVSGAFFMVPLNAHLQHSAWDGRSGQTLAANNFMMNFMGLIAVAIQYLMAQKLGISPQSQLEIYAIPALVVGWWVLGGLGLHPIRTLARSYCSLLFQVVPPGEFRAGVWLSKPLRWHDFMVLDRWANGKLWVVASPKRKFSFLERWLGQMWGIRFEVPHEHEVHRAVQAGYAVLWWSETPCPRSVFLPALGTDGIAWAQSVRIPVQLIWVDHEWPRIFRRIGMNAANLCAWRTRLPIHWGPVLASDQVNESAIRDALLQLGSNLFANRPELESNLGRQAIRTLQHHRFRVRLLDTTRGARSFLGIELLAGSLTLSRWIQHDCPEPRIGIVLPPGAGAAIANLAIILAGKIPVNLNFTAGKASLQAALATAQIKRVITARVLRERLKDFPWPEHVHDLETVLAALPREEKIGWLLAGCFWPSDWICRRIGLTEKGGSAEAALLFTSGSDGAPKGVIFTHRNILANVAQIESALDRSVVDSMLGCLPVFHSFGFTATLWWSLLGGPSVITHPSPLDVGRLAEIIAQYQPSLMLQTPTFLRAFLRKATPEQLVSLKMIVTGAEKTPLDLQEKFSARFQAPLCEGYGMTEASPVVSFNRLDRKSRPDPSLPHHKIGSVGPLVAGLAAQIRDPETGHLLPLGATGMLWLKGANVVPGYLNDPKRTAAVFQNAWYRTGDLGRLDADGFLYIEGRLSRFSKIAGEMVPHGVVELRLNEAFHLTETETLPLAVVGIPDSEKGEALVVLTAHDLPLDEVRNKLLAAGLPALWIPRKIHKVEAVPVLASGKLDLRACEALARSAHERS